MLPFDFYIYNKILLEYDGGHHFHPVEYWGGEKRFKYIFNLDVIKNKYCIENNITLIRIPYWEKDRLNYILDNVLNYFDVTKGECEDENVVEKYYVREGWDQEVYVEKYKKFQFSS